jgi:hypothetical protein
MHKLKLDLDQLTVETFDTVPPDGAQRGTVQGFSHVCHTLLETCDTCDPSCASCISCYGTCYNTCGPSCYGTCATCQTGCEQESCVYYCP